MQGTDYTFYPGGDDKKPRCCKICAAWHIACELEAADLDVDVAPARRSRDRPAEPRRFDKDWLLAQQFRPELVTPEIAQRAVSRSQMTNSTNITHFKDYHLFGVHQMRDCEQRTADGKTRKEVETATRPWKNMLALPALAAVFAPKEKAMRDQMASVFFKSSSSNTLSLDELVVLGGVSNYEPFTWVENPFIQEFLQRAGSRLTTAKTYKNAVLAFGSEWRRQYLAAHARSIVDLAIDSGSQQKETHGRERQEACCAMRAASS